MGPSTSVMPRSLPSTRLLSTSTTSTLASRVASNVVVAGYVALVVVADLEVGLVDGAVVDVDDGVADVAFPEAGLADGGVVDRLDTTVAGPDHTGVVAVHLGDVRPVGVDVVAADVGVGGRVGRGVVDRRSVAGHVAVGVDQGRRLVAVADDGSDVVVADNAFGVAEHEVGVADVIGDDALVVARHQVGVVDVAVGSDGDALLSGHGRVEVLGDVAKRPGWSG